jgi:hypothetical protein
MRIEHTNKANNMAAYLAGTWLLDCRHRTILGHLLSLLTVMMSLSAEAHP